MIKWLNLIQDNIIMTMSVAQGLTLCDKVQIYVRLRLMSLNNPSLTLAWPSSDRQEVGETTAPSLSILQVRTGSLKLIHSGVV